MDTIYNDVFRHFSPSQVQMTDGNKYVMLTYYKLISRQTFLLLDDRSVDLLIKLSSIHFLFNSLIITMTSLQGFQMLR